MDDEALQGTDREPSTAPSSSSLAPGSTLGYIYQCQVALLELVPYALTNADASVSLEVFDDVAFDFASGQSRRVIQVHHTVRSRRELIDTSTKLWRTLAIWAEEWQQRSPDESRVMTLLTTQQVRAGTALALLTAEHTNLDEAHRMLALVAADEDGAQGTARDRAIFAALDPIEQHAMLSRVLVIDGAPRAINTHARLQTLLAPTHERHYLPSMADGVEGRWWPRVVNALSTNGSIHADDLRTDIDEVRRTLSDHALPVLRLEDFSQDELPAIDPTGATFMACLQAIQASTIRRSRALDDYRRAFAHRSRWARRGLLGPGEYERYEDALFGQWVTACDRMLRALPDAEADDSKLASAGHDLWDRMEEDVRTALRRDTPDPFIQRGSLHQLAQDRRLAWHPTDVAPILQAVSAEDAIA